MMLLTSLLFIFSLHLVTLNTILEQDDCGGPLSQIEFDDILDACAYYSRCSQPTYKLNVNCILSSCPMLSSQCPLNSNGSVNINALNSAVSILNTCIGQKGLICDINMTHTPIVQVGWTTKNILPVTVVNGSVHLNPGTGFLDNFSSTTFTLIQTDNTQGSISLYIQAPNITMKAHLSCIFNLSEDSFFQPLKRQLLSTFSIPNSFTTPNVLGTYINNIASLISIDLSTSTPNINIIDDQSNIDIVYTNFVSSTGLPLPQFLVNPFIQETQNFIKNSDITSTAIIFLSTYVARGLQAAQINCP